MNRIKDLRLSSGWRQIDLADRLHIKKNTVSRYETGSLGIDADTVCALCDLFDVSADYLLCRTDIKKPKLTNEDARLLAAYHAAPENVREAILALLRPEQVSGKQVS